MLYQDLRFPVTDAGYYNYDHSIKPITDPGANSHYFWSISYYIQSTQGQGYMGLQTDVLVNGQNLGKGLVVALWGASNAISGGDNAGIHPNTDGDPGRSIYMPYIWEAGSAYRMRVWAALPGWKPIPDFNDDNGLWWKYFIRNEATGVDTYIGSLYYPVKSYLANSSIVWTEFYESLHRDDPCDSSARKPESVTFLNPSMNNDADNPGHQILPTSSSLRAPTCPNYIITQGTDYACIQSVNLTAE